MFSFFIIVIQSISFDCKYTHIIPLYEIENGFNVEKVDKDEFPYNIDKDRIYNIQLTTKKIHISAEMEPNEKVRYGGVVRSDWSVDLPIKGEDLIKATIKCDDYKINKNIKFEIDNLEKELYFESLYVSPIYAKLKFSTDIDGYNIGEKYHIEIKLEKNIKHNFFTSENYNYIINP